METSLIITSMSAHSPPLDTCLMERLKKNNPQTVLIGVQLVFPGWKNVTLKGFVQPAWLFWNSEDAHGRREECQHGRCARQEGLGSGGCWRKGLGVGEKTGGRKW